MQQVAVDADGDPLSGELVVDRVLPSAQGDQPAGVDGPVDLKRLTGVGPGFGGGGRDAGAAVGEQPAQVLWGEPGRHPFDPCSGCQQFHHGGVGPQSEGHTGAVGAKPELLPEDGQVPRRRTTRVNSTARSTGSTPLADMTSPAVSTTAGSGSGTRSGSGTGLLKKKLSESRLARRA
ncbi:hypothetical protein [Actinomadura luteofluorescens]|uniref:hypothetical protein n=1 Tax=Actinomadura luteofluorescens TaxID=46163 RepID=UPI003D8B1264